MEHSKRPQQKGSNTILLHQEMYLQDHFASTTRTTKHITIAPLS